MKTIHYAIIIAICLISSLYAEVAVTIYNDDLGLVRETREMDFPKGVGEVRFIDVAAEIIPTSVHFSSKMAALLEQNYEYDLVETSKLLQKYIDHEVRLITDSDDEFNGTLLTASGDIVIRAKDGTIHSLSRDWVVNIQFPDLPEGLITRPTLVWMVNSPKGGKGKADISYLTEGISWKAEYVAVTDKKDKSIQLTGWVNINNKSGATYNDARIKLMAGDVQIMRDYRRPKKGRAFEMTSLSIDAAAPQFEEQPFYEYHLYTLQRPSTLRDNQVKQISLFPTADVKSVSKEYRLDWQSNKKVKVTLIFMNEKKNGLGIPLPKGKVRVYKEGPDGGLEFIGEDKIDHTPQNEKVKVITGYAFDIVAEREMIDEERRKGATEKEFEIKLRNHKDETVMVKVVEQLRRDWTMVKATEGWKKTSAGVIEWDIKIKPEEEKVINYRVLYKR
ncbi:MAG: DUF4139 domain-containing protein [Candidatus Hatepunaea meridiana]|nr:DUF4139 domain-containing protein [Candidatus Hatepunaea meridiana]